MQYLEFEKPIEELNNKLIQARELADLKDVDASKTINDIENQILKAKKEIYNNLSPWQKVQLSRHPDRPYSLDYINALTNGDFIELHGDRMFSDDTAIIGGIGRLDDIPVLMIGHQKGRDTKERVRRNYGMPKPEGYRKSLRLMKLAEKFNLPIISFIDTPGAYPGLGAEERGQSEAIAKNLLEMSKISTPIISVIIGEGGSGGALAIGVSDKLLMLEYSIYSVISPEGCASILWKDSNMAEKAAGAMHITAEKLKKFSLIDEVIGEPLGGAHRDFEGMADKLKLRLLKNLNNLNEFDEKSLVSMRQKKIAAYGEYTQV